MEEIINLLAANPMIHAALVVLGCAVVLGQMLVPLTPSSKDDELLSKLQAMPIIGTLLKLLTAFAPVQKSIPPSTKAKK